ncbi:membrane fusion protein (multidrug efflux system) [Roseimicrobium gellanilyticum]|uniref:Membrane fusion protein (Multidrug efflux system) n=1 Tax=Roseimicrobium gellanilyticum TaxID=748857 RepID=A0A366HS69_9BACT|nr:efflux RND transporter periplasmic adaptor subunit [Roseimicrobium gellanilyticum]RBP46522.1 membrane fusion protein (multidrug efflux system) [Roseimicrobium gellanilyticum]
MTSPKRALNLPQDTAGRLLRSWQPLLLLPMLALSLTGCGKKPAGPPAGMGMMGGPMEVGVLTLAATPITLTQDLPGRTSAFRVAEVRARVNGIVLKRLFNEGSDVKEGDVLYEIDPAPYQAELDRAIGALARSEANAEAARIKEERYKHLVSTKAISQQELDDATASLHAFEADIISGKAAVQAAKINLGYTKVTSPVSGRVGISQVTEGAYVQAGTATLLVTVQQLDPMYVDVTQSSNDLMRLKKALAAGELSNEKQAHAKVELLLDDGEVHKQQGTLQFSDISVNPSTSSVTVRAIFPNPKAELLPGMFVRARLVEGRKTDALLVPQFAVSRNSKGEATAFVVGAEDKAEIRVLAADRTVGNQWLITSGLKSGDRVIMNNLQKLRPGAPVKSVPYAPPGAPAPAAKPNTGANTASR